MCSLNLNLRNTNKSTHTHIHKLTTKYCVTNHANHLIFCLATDNDIPTSTQS